MVLTMVKIYQGGKVVRAELVHDDEVWRDQPDALEYVKRLLAGAFLIGSGDRVVIERHMIILTSVATHVTGEGHVLLDPLVKNDLIRTLNDFVVD